MAGDRSNPHTPRPMPARRAAALLAAGLVGGLALVGLSANLIASASAEDADIFGFLRQAFGTPRAALREQPRYDAYSGYDPYARAQPPRNWRRRQADGARPGRRETLRRIRQERRLASRRAGPSQAQRANPGPRASYASLPAEPKLPRIPVTDAPDLTGTVDAAFVQQEGKAYRQAVGGRGGQSGWLAGRQTMCVRLCDGYAFPVGQLQSLSDLSLHRTACNTACPGAETALFTLRPGERDMSEARSLGGQSYGALRTALAYRQKLVPACSCHGPGQVALPRLPLSRDLTLRPGDIVAGTRSAYVLSRHKVPQFISLRQDRVLGHAARRQVEQAFGGRPADKVRVRLSAAHDEAAATEAAEPVSASGGMRVVLPSPY